MKPLFIFPIERMDESKLNLVKYSFNISAQSVQPFRKIKEGDKLIQTDRHPLSFILKGISVSLWVSVKNIFLKFDLKIFFSYYIQILVLGTNFLRVC